MARGGGLRRHPRVLERTVVFTAAADYRADAGRVFDVLTDWPRQTRWVPATAVERRGGLPGEPGERFAGVSRLGPFALDDVMVVVATTRPAPGRPGRVRVRKVGTLLGGTVDLVVRERGPGRARVEWTERLLLRPPALALAAALAGPLPALLGRAAFGAVLRAARADLEGRR